MANRTEKRLKNKRIEIKTDDETFNKNKVFKEALGYTNEDIYKIGLDAICNEKRLLKSRLTNIKEQNRILKQTIANNEKELFKIRYELYLKNPRELNPKDTKKLYNQFVLNYLDDLKICCQDSLTECLRIVKTNSGKGAIKEFAQDYNLDCDKFYNMVLDYLETIL